MATLFKSASRKALVINGPVELMPGDVAVADANDHLKTLLGSCVCVILTDPRRTVAAMSHIVHVGRPNSANTKNTAYGAVAMHDMYAHLRAKGVNPTMCHAYVYGGGNMFPQIFSAKHVGASNIEWVLNFLHEQEIFVADQSLGGTGYRKVSWTVGTAEPLIETIYAEEDAVHDR